MFVIVYDKSGNKNNTILSNNFALAGILFNIPACGFRGAVCGVRHPAYGMRKPVAGRRKLVAASRSPEAGNRIKKKP